jgi:hypothetical protein
VKKGNWRGQMGEENANLGLPVHSILNVDMGRGHILNLCMGIYILDA